MWNMILFIYMSTLRVARSLDWANIDLFDYEINS